jgi:hypothetical protein
MNLIIDALSKVTGLRHDFMKLLLGMAVIVVLWGSVAQTAHANFYRDPGGALHNVLSGNLKL